MNICSIGLLIQRFYSRVYFGLKFKKRRSHRNRENRFILITGLQQRNYYWKYRMSRATFEAFENSQQFPVSKTNMSTIVYTGLLQFYRIVFSRSGENYWRKLKKRVKRIVKSIDTHYSRITTYYRNCNACQEHSPFLHDKLFRGTKKKKL